MSGTVLVPTLLCGGSHIDDATDKDGSFCAPGNKSSTRSWKCRCLCQPVRALGNHTAIRSSPASEINCRLSHATTARTVSRQSNARSVSVVMTCWATPVQSHPWLGNQTTTGQECSSNSPLFIGFTGRAIPRKPSSACWAPCSSPLSTSLPEARCFSSRCPFVHAGGTAEAVSPA